MEDISEAGDEFVLMVANWTGEVDVCSNKDVVSVPQFSAERFVNSFAFASFSFAACACANSALASSCFFRSHKKARIILFPPLPRDLRI